jgi:hypothetical protein
MTLPNWTIRLIIAVSSPFLVILAAVEGAYNCLTDELFPLIKEAWRCPEDTRWGKNRRRI